MGLICSKLLWFKQLWSKLQSAPPAAAEDGAHEDFREVRRQVPGVRVHCRTNIMQSRTHVMLHRSTRHAISVYQLVEAACRWRPHRRAYRQRMTTWLIPTRNLTAGRSSAPFWSPMMEAFLR